MNEEPPHFGRPTVGSRASARELAANDTLPDAVIVLDSVGHDVDTPGSQRFASFWQSWAFGDRGRFLATAFRDPHHHHPTDDGQQIDYVVLAQVVRGIEAVVRERGATARR